MRDLHTPVGVMLRQMSQEELCYWIAYHNIENSDEESKKQKAAEQEQANKDEALKSLILRTWGKQDQSC